METKFSVFIATSLDGYIARKDGGIDWLDKANALVPAGEDCGYQAFFDTIDVLVMGRNAFEKILSFPAWPYGEKPVIVLSRNPLPIPGDLAATVSHSNQPPEELASTLAEQGVKRVYLDGGTTIQRFMAAGLVDDLTITLIPVLLGEGIPLFGPLTEDIPLRQVGSKTYDWGFVQLKYTLVPKSR